jgi:hypothetical protein
MSSNPTAMTLDGWSNQYVNESLWDDEDETTLLASNHKICNSALPRSESRIAMIPEGSLMSLFSYHDRNIGSMNGKIDQYKARHTAYSSTASYEQLSREILAFPRSNLETVVSGQDSEEIQWLDRKSRTHTVSSQVSQLTRDRKMRNLSIISDVLNSLSEEDKALEEKEKVENPAFLVSPVSPAEKQNKYSRIARKVTLEKTDPRLVSKGGLLASSFTLSPSPTYSRATSMAHTEDHKTKCVLPVAPGVRTTNDMVSARTFTSVLQKQLTESYYCIHGDGKLARKGTGSKSLEHQPR